MTCQCGRKERVHGPAPDPPEKGLLARGRGSGHGTGAPEPEPNDEVIDHSDHFVMPGLIDMHVHLSYGNAKSEEDIDLYAPVEFRALRGLESAQRSHVLSRAIVPDRHHLQLGMQVSYYTGLRRDAKYSKSSAARSNVDRRCRLRNSANALAWQFTCLLGLNSISVNPP